MAANYILVNVLDYGLEGVAIGREEMRSILNWLDPAASPVITIGVGSPSLLPS